MFLCLNRNSNEETIILDYLDNIEALRSLARAQELVCPQCKESVIVKAGDLKQSHFAHKSRGLCPLSNESASLLKARSILYHWLKSKWDNKAGTVTVEKNLHDDLPRHVDCYVDASNGKKHAYWILEKQLHNRNIFKRLLPVDVHINWVFLKEMLKETVDNQGQYNLTATERDLASESSYNGIYGHDLISLHYLDEKNETLTTLRGLSCKHSPQIYRSAEVLTNKMPDVLIAPDTGEFIHPGEPEKLKEYEEEEKSKQAQREQEAKEALRSYQLRQIERSALHQPTPLLSTRQEPVKRDNCNDIIEKLNQPLKCIHCGKMTTNWIMAQLQSGTCECRECKTK